ncbi:hypothetical protein [Nocardia sp. NPDC004711]
MSGFSDFLTHGSAPWWTTAVTTLAGTLIGAISTAGGGAILERVKDKNLANSEGRKEEREKEAQRRERVRDLGTRLIAEVEALQLGRVNWLLSQTKAKQARLEKDLAANPPSTPEEATERVKQILDAAPGVDFALDTASSMPERIRPLLNVFNLIAVSLPRELVELAREVVVVTLADSFPLLTSNTEPAPKDERADPLFAFMNGMRKYLDPAAEPLEKPLNAVPDIGQ